MNMKFTDYIKAGLGAILVWLFISFMFIALGCSKPLAMDNRLVVTATSLDMQMSINKAKHKALLMGIESPPVEQRVELDRTLYKSILSYER
tara:strand:+ start:554 stop:826 length:273 start_codon:yes stop_codon:yes gene_type:complete